MMVKNNTLLLYVLTPRPVNAEPRPLELTLRLKYVIHVSDNRNT